MLKSEPKRMHYHGWLLEIVPDGECFKFDAYHPELPGGMNEGEAYGSFESALVAGCDFIDREVAIQALLDIVGEWLENGNICADEYWTLTNFG
jgi:hypothetical protein